MNLSPNFSLDQMTYSQTAERYGIRNDPDSSQMAHLEYLCKEALEPIHAMTEGRMRITSGFRSPALNLRIGGSRNSQHSKGQAADFIVFDSKGERNIHLLNQIYDKIRVSNIQYDQLILEGTWIHISCVRTGGRRQDLIAEFINGKARYRVPNWKPGP